MGVVCVVLLEDLRQRLHMWHTGVCEKITPTEEYAEWNISFQSTQSGAGEWFLLLDCRARACAKGVFLFTDTGVRLRRRILLA